MKRNIKKIKDLQNDPKIIRNICILAHVDHGKTTLADNLIASNGIISTRLAGKLRYMDSREDEQIRGITMKASAISLHYKRNEIDFLINLIDSPGHVDFSSEVSTAVRLCDGALIVVDVVEGVCPQTHAVLRQAWLEKLKPILVLNKMDRLITELKMTPAEAHLHLQQVLEQVNAVTGGLFSAEVMEKMALEDNEELEEDNDGAKVYDWSAGFEESDDSNLYFAPEQGNVIFASAVDSWGFRIRDFARFIATKMKMNERVLNKTLWGDYYINTKQKKFFKGAQLKGKKSLFVQFILENIWHLYDIILVQKDKEKAEQIAKSLNLKISARDSRISKSDPKVFLHTIFGQWLPLSHAVLSSICKQIPSPCDIIEEKAEGLMCGSTYRFDALPPQTKALKQHFLNCDSSPDVPTIVLVSKMVSVEAKHMPRNRARPLTTEEIQARREATLERLRQRQADTTAMQDENVQQTEGKGTTDTIVVPEEQEKAEYFIAFARVFSGVVKPGQSLYVLGPKHDPVHLFSEKTEDDVLSHLDEYDHITKVEVGSLYAFMGRELEPLESATAGCVVGIEGLECSVINSATLCSTLACPPFNPLSHNSLPIIRVAVEPNQLSEMPILVDGLKLLNQADPCVQVLVQDTGEHVIVTAGEVHLQRCLDDLRNRFAKIEINASSPIVPFRETVVARPKLDMMHESIGTQELNLMEKYQNKKNDSTATHEYSTDETNKKSSSNKQGSVTIQTPNKACTLVLRAVPMPTAVFKVIEEHSDHVEALSRLDAEIREYAAKRRRTVSTNSSASSIDEIETSEPSHDALDAIPEESALNKVKSSLMDHIRELRVKLQNAFNESGGRKWAGVADNIWAFGNLRNGPNILINKIEDYSRSSIWSILSESEKISTYRDFDASIGNGFSLACNRGPLCEEPIYAVCFIVQKWDYNEDSMNGIDNFSSYGPLSGQLISTMKDGCRKAFQAQPQRLMAAMYTCDVQATADVLGKVYAVLGKREGRVLSEEMKDGSDIFNITATLPVAESFGFAEEIRKRTSGLASPQLMFSHWEVIASDPFWVPTTEEEIQHFGEKADFENPARKYMNSVRRRKGLFVDEKTVEFAEKQRTLTKNK